MFRIVLGVLIVVGACSKSDGVDADPFDTFQACYDEHHGEEGLTNKEAITTCCLDHPIAGMAANTFCGATEPDCETKLRANTDGTVSDAQITEGCTDYIMQASM